MTFKALLFIAVILLIYIVGKKSINTLVSRIGLERSIAKNRVQYVNSVLVLIWSVLAFLAVGMVAGVGYEDFGLFFTSVFAILGVALFAQWSILSNVTASIIVFFFFPYRVGDFVKILDGDNSIEGTITDITLFHVILADGDRRVVTFPNAMAFQKAVTITQPEQYEPETDIDGETDNR